MRPGPPSREAGPRYVLERPPFRVPHRACEARGRPRPGHHPEPAGGWDGVLLPSSLLGALHGDPLDADLGAVLLEGDGAQLELDPFAQPRRGHVAAAPPTHQGLELLLDAELAQARGALLEVL